MLRELLRRRVPQILGGYLLVIWGVVQFVEFLVGRYGLPSQLVEAVGGGMLLLIPSIALLTYGHGSPGPDSWSRSERVVVPVNVIIALVAGIFFFRGDPALGKVTETVEVENEQGVVEERLVPRREYMQRVTSFFLDNRSSDPDLDYVGILVPHLMAITFLQDLSTTVTSPLAHVDQFKEAGYEDGMGIPRALQREIAERVHSPHYLTGSFTTEGDDILIQLELFDGAHRSLATHEVRGPELMSLADQLAELVRVDLGLPESYRREIPLLPLADIMTSSPEALRHFADGTVAFALRNDYASATAELKKAVELDPTFCNAHFQLYVVHLLNGSPELAPSLEAALKHSYRVPEAQQFSIKMNHFYQIKQDGEKALSVGRMWVKLYPDDADAHTAMLQLLSLASHYDEALASVDKLRELDPTRDELFLVAGDLLSEKGDYESALAEYREYARRNPKDTQAFLRLSRHMEDFGRLEPALEPLETALLLDPTSVDIVLQRASIYEALGRRDEADADLAEAASLATAARHRFAVLQARKSTLVRRGRLREAVEARAGYLDAAREFMGPIQVAVTGMMDHLVFLELGQPEAARTELETLGQNLQETLAPYASIGLALLTAELGEIATAEKHLEAVRVLVDDQKLEAARGPMQQARARVREHSGDLPGAIAALSTALEGSPRSVTTLRELARLQRLHGDLDAAESALARALTLDPTHPRLHVQSALLAQQRGDVPAAIQHVEAALEVWSEADPDYARAREARELLEELTRNP